MVASLSRLMTEIDREYAQAEVAVEDAGRDLISRRSDMDEIAKYRKSVEATKKKLEAFNE